MVSYRPHTGANLGAGQATDSFSNRNGIHHRFGHAIDIDELLQFRIFRASKRAAFEAEGLGHEIYILSGMADFKGGSLARPKK